MKKMIIKPKFKVGGVAYVVDSADFVLNNTIRRIPLGTEVTVRAVGMLQPKNHPSEVRYEIGFEGGPLVCWIDEDCLSPLVLDIAA